MTNRQSTAGINGFGRFGLGLFRSWFEDPNSSYRISYINDDILSITDIIRILKEDPIVTEFNTLSISHKNNVLLIRRNEEYVDEIEVTRGPAESASWVGQPDLVFECSGRTENFNACRAMLVGNTKNIIIGATTDVSDSTLVMGYNHSKYNKFNDKVISFGSCTVIPGIHMLSFVQSNLKVQSCLINIVHSVPKWQLDEGMWKTISRKTCSLESVAPKLIDSIEPADLKVNYTYAPYYGVSLMDFAFTIENRTTTSDFVSLLSTEICKGDLKNIVSMIDDDNGAEHHANSRSSLVLIKSSIDIRDHKLFFFGYFNNEGSGIRLHELANFINQMNSSNRH